MSHLDIDGRCTDVGAAFRITNPVGQFDASPVTIKRSDGTVHGLAVLPAGDSITETVTGTGVLAVKVIAVFPRPGGGDPVVRIQRVEVTCPAATTTTTEAPTTTSSATTVPPTTVPATTTPSATVPATTSPPTIPPPHPTLYTTVAVTTVPTELAMTGLDSGDVAVAGIAVTLLGVACVWIARRAKRMNVEVRR